MRKFLVAVCLVSIFTFVADTASARARIGRAVSSKPAPVKTMPKPEAAKAAKASKAAERPAAPRTWIVAMPRPASQPAAAPFAAADIGAGASPGAFTAASWDAMPSVESPASAPAADAASEEPAAAPPAPPETAPQAPTRVVALNTTPSPRPARAAPVQPHDVVICYWNRAGQCVP
jgi:hypothetical protein